MLPIRAGGHRPTELPKHLETPGRCCSETKPAGCHMAGSSPSWLPGQTGEALAHHCCSSFFIFIASSGSCHVLLTVTGPITQDLQLVVFCAAHHIFRMAYRLLYESDCYNHHSR